MKRLFAIATTLLIFSLFFVGLRQSAEAARPGDDKNAGMEYNEKDGFVIHEWGVITETRREGRKVVYNQPDDLPDFVQNLKDKFPAEGRVRPGIGDKIAMKPIIYFYGPKEKKFGLEILSSYGTPLFAWPACDANVDSLAKAEGKKADDVIKKVIEKGGIGNLERWNMVWKDVRITGEQNKGDWKKTPEGHWIDTARDVHAPGIQIGKDREKFIFYEGNVDAMPSVFTLEKTDDGIKILNYGNHKMLDVYIIKVTEDGLQLGFLEKTESAGALKEKLRELEKKGEIVKDPNDFLKAKIRYEKIAESDWKGKTRDDLVARLKTAGLYSKEAQGMADIWNKDFFEKKGIRVIYRMPQKQYDEIYPMTLTEKPDTTVRVMLHCIELE